MAVCAGITYNAVDNLITIDHHVGDGTRGSVDHDDPYRLIDVYDTDVDNGWGVVEKLGDNFFLISAQIYIDVAFFQISGNESIEFTPSGGSADRCLESTPLSKLYIKGGSSYASIMHTGGILEAKRMTLRGELQIDNVVFINVRVSTFTGDVAGSYLKRTTFVSCSQMMRSGHGLTIEDITFIGGVYAFNYTSAPNNTVNRVTMLDSNMPFLLQTSGEATVEFRDITVLRPTSTVLVMSYLRGDVTVNMINCDLPKGIAHYSFYGTIAGHPEFTGYINLVGIYKAFIENGDGGTITIYDKNDDVVYTEVLTTDEMSEQELTYYYIKGHSLAGTTAITLTEHDLEPFKVVVEKAGYQTLEVSGITVTAGEAIAVRSSLLREPLQITAIDIIDVSRIGASDGQLVVTAAGGDGSYEYSIDNVNWQASNTFTGLAAGDYTVYVRDGQTVPFTDSFAVKIIPRTVDATKIQLNPATNTVKVNAVTTSTVKVNNIPMQKIKIA